jgi:hypothetical protein
MPRLTSLAQTAFHVRPLLSRFLHCILAGLERVRDPGSVIDSIIDFLPTPICPYKTYLYLIHGEIPVTKDVVFLSFTNQRNS